MRIGALVKRICRQMLRDKRTLALMMIAPLIILTLIHFLFTSDNDEKAKVGVFNVDRSLLKQLESKDLTIIKYDSVKDTKKLMVNNDLDGFLQLTNNRLNLTIKNDDPTTAKAVQMKVQQVITSKMISQLSINTQKKLPIPKIDTSYVYGNKNTTFFDILNPILIGFFVFFFVFLISGIALLRERTTGTLDRLVATPIKRSDIVFGYLLGYGIFAVIQTIIVVFYAIKVLNITLIGSIWNVLLINMLLALVALSLGTLLSAFANTEFQMMQFIPIVVIPQVFFAGIFPVEGMAHWLQIIAKFMPMYYGGDALRSVMYKGAGLNDINIDILVLLGFAILFIILNVFALKKYRKI